MKPLGQKSYGSIPHLPGSRLGPGDHHCSEGQARIATVKPRDKHDKIIVQEKLDGSNVGVCKVDGKILAITRSGYIATTSKYKLHHDFSSWVDDNWSRFVALLKEGERVCGEWLATPHGTQYNLPHEPFVPFDIMRKNYRFPYLHFVDRVLEMDFTIPNLIHYATGESISIESAMEQLSQNEDQSYGGHGAVEPVEGAVWRVERKGEVDFLCKFVRHDKADGKYLDMTQ